MSSKIINSFSTVAYFSMEIGIDASIPTYSGGLGVLAGDTIRAAADMGVPMVGITLLYHKGYFRQHLDKKGRQTESPHLWSPETSLQAMHESVTISIEGRAVHLTSWRFDVIGINGHKVPVYFLDTSSPQNASWDQNLTSSLYAGDNRFRLCQEMVLGYGGIKMLRALGYDKESIHPYHMNEGHSALLTLALLEERVSQENLLAATEQDKEDIRKKCVFTTHTPVPAGHDQFARSLAEEVLGKNRILALEKSGSCLNGILNMTNLALSFSYYVNGVTMRHKEISRGMFPNYPIDSITNGVHAATWTAPSFRTLFDRHMPQWRQDNLYLRNATCIPPDRIREAHAACKRTLFEEVKRRTALALDPEVFTIGFARRATAYKRTNLIFFTPDKLKRLARQIGPIQIVYAGKAHPQDMPGKELIQSVFRAAEQLKDAVKIVYLEDYDMELAKTLCAGVDVWLNTPQKPQEASGTSGMKAALNGVPSLSILDGWWIEGHVEGVTGWSIGSHWEVETGTDQEVEALYDKLEFVILPLFYGKPSEFDKIMRSTVALNGSFFNAQRMLFQYVQNVYAKI